MTTHKHPLGSDEEDPERTADYHQGIDNSIKDVTRSIMDSRRQQGGKLSGVDEQDMSEVEDPKTQKPEPKQQK